MTDARAPRFYVENRPGAGGSTPAEFGKFMHDEIRKWADVVKVSDAKME